MMLYPLQLADGVPVGILNNNPGNIWNDPNIKFEGEITEPGAQWKKFISMAWGYRALIKNLQAYIKAGIDTLPEITSKWAPAGHGSNNPVSYANHLEQMTGIPQWQVIESTNYDALAKIAYGISYIEQGVQPSVHEINEGINLLRGGGSAPVATITNQQAQPQQAGFNWVTGVILIAAVGLAYREYEKTKYSRRRKKR